MSPKKKTAAPPPWMTGSQFDKAIKKLGFNQSSFARAIGVNGRTVRAWISEKYPIPRYLAQLLNLMIETEATAENLKP